MSVYLRLCFRRTHHFTCLEDPVARGNGGLTRCRTRLPRGGAGRSGARGGGEETPGEAWARRPEEGGRSILFPALVETYAVVALLAGILMMNWLTNPDIMKWMSTLGQAAVEAPK